MNSTATKLEFTRRRAMRGIVKVFVVGTLGLAGLLVPAGYVHSAQKETLKSCLDKGYAFCEGGTCASGKCGGQSPGTTICGKYNCYMCDGCTSTWIVIRGSSEPTQPWRGGVVAPRPGGVYEPPASGPSGPRSPGSLPPVAK